jgi:hypothetical protein
LASKPCLTAASNAGLERFIQKVTIHAEAGHIDDRNMADDDFKKYSTLHQIPMTTSK